MSEPRSGRRPSIAVVGAGQVGRVCAVGLARMGQTIELVETDTDRLVQFRNGHVPFSEPGVQEALTGAFDSGSLTMLDGNTDTNAGVVLICIGTPIADWGHASMSAVEAVLADLDSADARGLMAKPLVIDGRRQLDPAAMLGLGYQNECVGSPPSEAVVGVS